MSLIHLDTHCQYQKKSKEEVEVETRAKAKAKAEIIEKLASGEMTAADATKAINEL